MNPITAVYQTIASPLLFTGTEIGLGLVVAGPVMNKWVEQACRGIGSWGSRVSERPLFTALSRIPRRPIRWLPGSTVFRVFAASFLYAFYMFGPRGLPEYLRPPNENSSSKGLGGYLAEGGLVLGVGTYLNRRYGDEVLWQSESLGRYTKADPINWALDYASNVFIFCPLIAKALRAPLFPFMLSGVLLYWAAILGAARMTSIWAEEKGMHIAIGRGLIFFLTNAAFYLKANDVISHRTTNRIQLTVALLLSAATYLFTSGESNQRGAASH